MNWKSCSEHKNDRIFNLLYQEAERAPMIKKARHTCAIVYRKRVLAIGHAKRKTHPIERKWQRKTQSPLYLHAEKDAIIKTINKHGDEILKECSLYVLRVMHNGNIGFSKPCESCNDYINFVGIKKVYWS